MRKAKPTLAALLVGVVVVAVNVVPATGAQSTQIFGIDSSSIDASSRSAPPQDVAARMVRATGSQVMRMGITWSYVQPKAGTWRWQKYDDETAAIRAEGMRPLIMLHDAPAWAEVDGCTTKHCPPAPAHYAEWALFAGTVALHFPDAVGIEIWNSPNTKAWWPVPGGSDPAAYANVFARASNRIHTVAPGMPVIFGDLGSHGFKDTKSGLSIPSFLRGFYSHLNANALAAGDGLAIHAYPAASEIDSLDGRFAKVLDQARTSRNQGDPIGAARKLWITESGITTTGGSGVTEAQQARALINVTSAVAAMPDVAALTLFTLIELRSNSTYSDQAGYGIVRRAENGSLIPKQAFCALVHRAGNSAAGCPA